MNQNAPIGVFDSGIGGLTVVREIMRQMPDENIVYFGDTARVPYGSKSQQTVLRYSRQIVAFLKTQNVKAIVVACNTASALALNIIEKEIDIPIVGVIRPGARVAAKATRNKRVGVIGTNATISSEVYTRYLQEIDPDIQVYGKACPLFVPMVEEGMIHDFITEEMAKRYLKDMEYKSIDTLILGCTHYPLLRSMIGRLVGPDVVLVNPAYETAIELRNLLRENGLLCVQGAEPEHRYDFYVSDDAEKFREFADSILPYDIKETKLIQNIEDYV